ncbi:uncharacterized protein BDR25DRAFT_304076 [Lindgomyces ingoldianus]|uniref:Uncharacterized protein n=1 Tax=Lindgomyces ingoldianus TaxID=673940 RepID=A0ACB6QVM2_9PLEO|nr:uncharacterized protein BDR25DRAFT_304076 [Lindgomyces ingoldianus]KAF2470122.1 hypothetical protein BDR25DRAFT_304076 [Lindgomyces ingoldianus]
MSEQEGVAKLIQEIPKDYQNIKNPEDIPWFVKELTNIKPDARDLFENYCKIPSEDVVPHIKQIRDKAFKVYPYPCLGHWGFLDLSISQSPKYDEILQRVKNGDNYLDLGCCFGQDIRKLVHDGAPSEHTFGSDLQKDFMDLGYDLFLDKSTLKTTFIPANIFEEGTGLMQLVSKIDIVHAASFFHLFDWPEQVQIAKRLVTILKAKPGSLVVGRQIGHTDSGELARQIESSKSRFRHNEASFARMWKEVGEATGTDWLVDAHLEAEDLGKKSNFKYNFIPAGTRWLRFTVCRL